MKHIRRRPWTMIYGRKVRVGDKMERHEAIARDMLPGDDKMCCARTTGRIKLYCTRPVGHTGSHVAMSIYAGFQVVVCGIWRD